VTKASFTQGVKANVQLKSNIPFGAKVEISPKGFTLGIKAEIEKNFSTCPKLLINAELLWPCIGPKAEKRIPLNLGGAYLQLLGPMFQHLLIS
jgi:hypothetical protein